MDNAELLYLLENVMYFMYMQNAMEILLFDPVTL